jgi:heme exporter protein C
MRISLLGVLVLILVPLSLAADFLYAPTERTQGQAQRIFYLHLPLAWLAYLSFFLVFVASVLYLWKRAPHWDHLGRSAAEIGVIFTTLVLITGSIWARPIWGAWWSWDARLTTTLVLWFIYVGYLTTRSHIADERRGARYAAVLGIVGFIDVPIIHQSVTWWRSQHPDPIVLAPGGPQMPLSMLITFGLSMLAFTLFFAWLLQQRYRLEAARAELGALRERRAELMESV